MTFKPVIVAADPSGRRHAFQDDVNQTLCGLPVVGGDVVEFADYEQAAGRCESCDAGVER